MLVWVLVSQPLAGLPSQFAKPGKQAPITQTPLLQDSCASAKLQAVPQVPQSARLALRFASQPFDGSLSQSAKPRLQVSSTQLPLTQFPEAFEMSQTLPQP